MARLRKNEPVGVEVFAAPDMTTIEIIPEDPGIKYAPRPGWMRKKKKLKINHKKPT